MIDGEPAWKRSFDADVSSWCSHVWLHDDRAVGQWFCLDRADGRVIWQQSLPDVNSIEGITKGVILATLVREGFPPRGGRGCQAIELSSGALLWTKPAGSDRWWKRSGMAVREVVDGELVCMDGTVLDARSGEPTRQVEAIRKVPGRRRRRTESSELLDYTNRRAGVEVAPGRMLFYDYDLPEDPLGGLRGRGTDGTGEWTFSLSSTTYHCAAMQLVSPFFYYLVSDKPLFEPETPGGDKFVRRVIGQRHLLTIDARTGELEQDITLGEWRECSIEDADPDGLLLSFDRTTVSYFRRRG